MRTVLLLALAWLLAACSATSSDDGARDVFRHQMDAPAADVRAPGDVARAMDTADADAAADADLTGPNDGSGSHDLESDTAATVDDAGGDVSASETDAGHPPMPEPEDIARRFAPIWYQDTANRGPDDLGARMDVPTIVDFDADLVHRNNWENLANVEVSAAIYWALVATETHYFLTYSQYHARDWEQVCLGLAGLCHEGDMESAGVIVRRDATGYGLIELVWTHAHGVNSYWSTVDVGEGALSVSGGLDFEDDTGEIADAPSERHTHVRLFSQTHGHGLVPCSAEGLSRKPFGIVTVSCPDGADRAFPGGDGLKLISTTDAALPFVEGMQDAGEPVGYELVPVETTLWAWRSDIGEGRLFREDGSFTYTGSRGPPFESDGRIGHQFDSEQFLNDSSGGKPPWVGTMRGSSPSDVFFDPAWALRRALPDLEPAIEYVHHPYMGLP